MPANNDSDITALYTRLLTAWNDRSAAAYAACFTPDGSAIGFDGSQMNGRVEIETTLSAIFTDHVTARYVAQVREVRFLGADTALLRAVAGLVARQTNTLNAAANSIQSLVAIQRGGAWEIALFQNTPAAFHGRPEAAAALTAELQALI